MPNAGRLKSEIALMEVRVLSSDCDVEKGLAGRESIVSTNKAVWDINRMDKPKIIIKILIA